MNHKGSHRQSVLDQFGAPELIRELLGGLTALPQRLRLMEVCGTHTMALFETGLRQALKERGINLLSGPGCPVCVTDQADLEHVFAVARLPGVTLCSFGDMLRVPGSSGSLEMLRAGGADVRVVYSPLDAVDLAESDAGLNIVFLSVGFETTAPAIGCAIQEARARGLDNFHVFPLNKTIPPALHALAQRPDIRLDGLLLPGHVSVIIGAQAYEPVAREHDLPCAITGFEPVDILRGVLSLVEQSRNGVARVDNSYSRVVPQSGNRQAISVLNEVFIPADANWRGLGCIPRSGLVLSEEYAQMDARLMCQAPVECEESAELQQCRCGDVLCGLIEPPECPLFATACNPEQPVGACMVSQEGSCRAYFRHYGAA